MKILFLYRHGILGGVCTQLFHRFRNIPDDLDIEIHCGFRNDYGVKDMLSDYATLHFNLNKENTVSFLGENIFDVIIIIDSYEYVEALREIDHSAVVFIEVHTSIERNLEYLSRLQVSDFDAFITVSEYMKDRIRYHVGNEMNGKRIITIGNVLDSTLFIPEKIDTKGSPIVSWVGKIDDHKDWKAFINIASHIHKDNTEIEFWIIGGQTCPEELAQNVFDLAEEVGIISRFKWIDRVETQKMGTLYSLIAARGGLSLVTSHCESFGMSILESLLAGCPVVSSEVGAISEITEPAPYLELYSRQNLEQAATLCTSVLSDIENVKELLNQQRPKLTEKYDSAIHSIFYWRILATFVKSNEKMLQNLVSKYMEQTDETSQFDSKERLLDVRIQNIVRVSNISYSKILSKDYMIDMRNFQPSKLANIPTTIRELQEVRIAGIMDEFTYNSYLDTCELINLSFKNWESELSQFKPDIVFIESAWKGKNSEWQHKINRTDVELFILSIWCRKRKIPTIFWNKEDPVHYGTFLSTAGLFDYVFTSDIDCIQNYKSALGHSRVYGLPFACNPKLTNPIEKYSRKQGASFAGAYYTRYPERAENLVTMISALSEIMSVDIYDRNLGTNDKRYQFPPDFEHLIVGTLEYDEIDKSYKGYKFGINMNSVKLSQSMFARRAFELMASNTIVLSNYSRAMRILFGDLIICSDGKDEIISRIKNNFLDDESYRKIRLAGLRKTLKHNTYLERLHYLVTKVSGKESIIEQPTVQIISKAENIEQYELAVQNYVRQEYPNRSLLIITSFEKDDFVKSKVIEHDIITVTDFDITDIEATILKPDFVAFLSPLDYYGRNYLTDLQLGFKYSDTRIVTKSSHYVALDSNKIKRVEQGSEYKMCIKSGYNNSMIEYSLLNEKILGNYVLDPDSDLLDEENRLSIDEFNYCKNYNLHNCAGHLESTICDIEDLDVGCEVSEILEIGELMNPESTEKPVEKYLYGAEVFHDSWNGAHKDVKFEVEGENLLIHSTLAASEHTYFYSSIISDIDDLCEERTLFFECGPGLNVSLVIRFLNESGEVLSTEIVPSNVNHTWEIIDNCTQVKLGLRIYSSGSCDVKRVLFEHRDLSPKKIITQHNNLILANNYPSYHDLYKNGFLHSRASSYREMGVNVDIFTLNNKMLNYYEFHNIDVISGTNVSLGKVIEDGKYKNIMVHFLDEEMWEVIKDIAPDTNIFIWAHGVEIQPWYRRMFNYPDDVSLEIAKIKSEERMEFWRSIFSNFRKNMKMIFVSKYFANEVMEDLGIKLKKSQFEVIHNPIDTSRFKFVEKTPEQRKKVLSIRTFASPKYGNDISVNAIIELSKYPFFDDLEFMIAGDGELFDEITAPLKKFTNVTIRKGFLSNKEYEEIFLEYGIFLTPTRWDSHGVSRDEAMSAGLVPATNNVSAIPEFVDASCAILANAEDHVGLAEGIAELYHNPELFIEMSNNAAQRVRKQTCSTITIPQELALMERKT